MTVTMGELDWRGQAVCFGASEELLFPDDPNNDEAAVQFCKACPVRELCLEDALRLGARDGVRGGLSEAKRAPLHDAYEKRVNSLVARKFAIGTRRHMTQDDKLELADLRQARGYLRGSNISARQMFRFKIGELKAAGVDYRELIEFLRNWAVSDIAAERQIWRATFEYRTALNREGALADNAKANYLNAVSNAPTEASRAYWQTKADEVLLLS